MEEAHDKGDEAILVKGEGSSSSMFMLTRHRHRPVIVDRNTNPASLSMMQSKPHRASPRNNDSSNDKNSNGQHHKNKYPLLRWWSSPSKMMILFYMILATLAAGLMFLMGKEENSPYYQQDFRLILRNFQPRSPLSEPAELPKPRPKITFIVLADPKSLNKYKNNLATINCYAKLQGYEFMGIDVSESCRQQGIKNFFFLKHCTVLEHMRQEANSATQPNLDSWYVVLDGDNAVVNNNHRVEEYIAKGGGKDVIHGLRFHNNEVMAGNYLIKNTVYSRQYLQDWVSLHPENPETPYAGYNQIMEHYIGFYCRDWEILLSLDMMIA
jgi:hypothetical protein